MLISDYVAIVHGEDLPVDLHRFFLGSQGVARRLPRQTPFITNMVRILGMVGSVTHQACCKTTRTTKGLKQSPTCIAWQFVSLLHMPRYTKEQKHNVKTKYCGNDIGMMKQAKNAGNHGCP